MAKLIGKMYAVMSVAAFALITLDIATQIGCLDWLLEHQVFCSSNSVCILPEICLLLKNFCCLCLFKQKWALNPKQCHFCQCHFCQCHFCQCHFYQCHFCQCHFCGKTARKVTETVLALTTSALLGSQQFMQNEQN
jgi:hypothetical protein